MDFRELVETLWRRKLTVVAVLALSLGVAIAALQFVTPEYESRSTVVIQPENEVDFSFFYALNSIVPIYANAAQTAGSYEIAQRRLGDREPATVSVETFRDTPIIRIKARDPDKVVARDTAQAFTDALLQQVRSGAVGVPSLRISQIDRPQLALEPVYPRTG